MDMTDTIRTFNRFELKYFLPAKIQNKFQTDLLKYLEPDTNGDNFGNYVLSSLYYDTDEYRFYHEKINGIKFRRKLRIRHYETAADLKPESIVFLEIKQRFDKVIHKRRAALPYQDALNLCNTRIVPISSGSDKEVIDEVLSMIIQYDLKPKCITSYLRKAFTGGDYDTGLRVTFDTNIRYRTNDNDLSSRNPGKLMIDPEISIMEIKVNGAIPYWLTQLTAKYNLSLIRISKYCTGLEASEKVSGCIYQIF